MKNIINRIKTFSATTAGQLILGSIVSIIVSVITTKVLNKKGE